jgi:hypothetical protein
VKKKKVKSERREKYGTQKKLTLAILFSMLAVISVSIGCVSAENLDGTASHGDLVWRMGSHAGLTSTLDVPITGTYMDFTDVASEYGVNDSHQGRATVWFDYDNDGDLDLLLTVSNGNYTILYRNDGDTFVDVAEEVNLSEMKYGLSVGDYDNDGDLDILCDGLFRNDINATDSFTEVGFYTDSLFVDYDNDGDLDIYRICFWGSNKLFRNDGETGYVEIQGALGADDSRHSRSAVLGDYDNDGDLDLYVVNGRGERCSLYRNDVDTIGRFTDVTAEMNVGDEDRYANGACWGDYDNDGDLDLYLAKCESGLNRLYRNDVNTLGTFTEVGKSLGVADNPMDSFHAGWGDYDNDGDLDLYVVNGASKAPSRLYRNDVSEGNGFVETDEMANEGSAMGGSWGDFDADGDIDYYLVGSYPGYVMTNRLYQNNNSENGNHWLHINAIGTLSNRAAIGTTIKVVAGDLTQTRYVESTSGFGSQNSLPVEFGLGAHSTVDSVIIKWPSGRVQNLTDVEVNQFLNVYEYTPVEPCPAKNAVYQADVPDPEGILNPLRELRDDNLKIEYVDRYYENSPALTMVMRKDPALEYEAARLLARYSPMVCDHVNVIGVDKPITRGEAEEIVSFTDWLKRDVLENRGEIGAKKSQEIIMFLDEFTKQVEASEGKTFSQALRGSIYYEGELMPDPAIEKKWVEQVRGNIYGLATSLTIYALFNHFSTL